MFIPPEILLDIVERLNGDRETLYNLRLADKHFYYFVTDILFKDFEFIMPYGYKSSIPWMKVMTKSFGLRLYIRELHLPSESFFPIAKNFKFRADGIYKFPWSRSHALKKKDYKSTEEDLLLSSYSSSDNCYEQKGESKSCMFQRCYVEVPNKRDRIFSFAVKRYKKEYDTYKKTLVNFLGRCTNLRAIHITTGLGYDAERSQAWCSLIGDDVFPVLAKLKIDKLEISVASVGCLYQMLSWSHGKAVRTGRPPVPMLPSVTTLALKVQPELKVGFELGIPDFRSKFRYKMNGFISNMPNITTYSIGNVELAYAAIEIAPPLSSYSNLASLNLSSLYFTEEVLNDFKSMIDSMPLVTDLTLDTIAIDFPGNLDPPVERYPEPEFIDGRTIATYSLTNMSIEMSWGCVFELLQTKLPKLIGFSIKRLIYGSLDIYGEPLLYVPVPDCEDYDRGAFLIFAVSTWDMGLISTLDSDYFALSRIRQHINEKRRNIGFPESKCDARSRGFAGPVSEEGILSENDHQFTHRTKNRRVIKVGARGVWRLKGHLERGWPGLFGSFIS